MLYTIRPILKLLLFAPLVICGILFAAQAVSQKQLPQIKEGLQRYGKAVPRILLVSILCGALCMGFFMTGMPYSGSFRMSFTYPKASKGLTPNSTTLDASEILSNEVLERAVENEKLGNLSVGELKNTLGIGNVKARDRVSVDELYVSTEYEVSYNASKRTASLDKDVLLKAVSDAYYEYFTESYGRKTDVLEEDYSGVTDLDYLDVHKYLDSQINNVIEYMDMCSAENATFVSDVTQESFGSIKDKAKNFQDVSLERYQAYVLKYGLSHNSGQYISRLNYENRVTNVEYLKNLAAYRVRIAAIDRYDGDITRAVLVPTRDEDGEFYQSRTKIGTDYFAADANARLEAATANQLNIETNNYHIQSLSTATGGDAQREEADKMVEALKKEISSITNQAIETIEDYDAQTANGYISFVFPDRFSDLQFFVIKSALYAVILFTALSVVILTNADALLKKRKKNKKLKVI